MPNADRFYDDDREKTERSFWKEQPCMQDCKSKVEILGRARVLDVTPESKTAPRVD
jgi:cytochrome c